jgi:FKBP-type peptidyl-prolyl cis-trans isomerase
MWPAKSLQTKERKMNKIFHLSIIIWFSLVLAGCENTDPGVNTESDSSTEVIVGELLSEAQKVSYIMGINIGAQIKTDGIDFQFNEFNMGIKDALADAKPRLSDEEVGEVIEKFQARVVAEREAAIAMVSDNNLKEGEAFLAEKSETESVVALESGLYYKVIKEGSGPSPTVEDTVEVDYKGTLIDGTEFDSSYKRGAPAQFGVTQVIPGWVEALQLMKEGAVWELYVPPELAYGPGGTGGVIGPNQTLIFEVALLKASINDDGEVDPEN